jgi:hypothetical protein
MSTRLSSENQLNAHTEPFLIRLLDLQKTGLYRFFLVGGCVRNAMLGYPSNDIDIVCDGAFGKLMEALEEEGVLAKESLFNTAKVKGESVEFDIASPRTECYSTGDGMPTVMPGTLAQDLMRRDFTVNTAYVPLTEDHFNAVVSGDGKTLKEAVFQAHPLFFDDIGSKKLRILHASSFEEDPSRLLRIVKYETLYGFAIEADTFLRLKSAVAERAIERYAKGRLRDLVFDLITGRGGVAIAERLKSLDIIAFDREPERAYERICSFSEAYDLHLRERLCFAASLFEPEHSFWRGAPKNFSKILNDWQEIISGFKSADEKTYLTAYKIVYNKTVESLVLYTQFSKMTSFETDFLKAYWTSLRHIQLSVTGADLLALGLESGPTVGHALDALLAHELACGQSFDKDREIQWIKREWHGN